MADCEKFTSCGFFKERMHNMPSIAELFKKRLCQGNKSECARYFLYNSLKNLNFAVTPELESKITQALSNLFPNELTRAKKLFLEIGQKR